MMFEGRDAQCMEIVQPLPSSNRNRVAVKEASWASAALFRGILETRRQR